MPSGNERIVFESKFFEIAVQPMKIGAKIVEFEFLRRSPGVRLLIIKDNKMLLNREFRSELNSYDYRLPGGKVFDTLKEYKNTLKKENDILKHAIKAAKKECEEETGLIVNKLYPLKTSHCGATVVWDLLYFVVDDFKDSAAGQKLEAGEVIENEWKTFEEVKNMCLNGKIKEDRSVGVLLQFFMGDNSKTYSKE